MTKRQVSASAKHDAITADRSSVVALADMLQAIFDADQPVKHAASSIDLRTQARCLSMQVIADTHRAKHLFELARGAKSPAVSGASSSGMPHCSTGTAECVAARGGIVG